MKGETDGREALRRGGRWARAWEREPKGNSVPRSLLVGQAGGGAQQLRSSHDPPLLLRVPLRGNAWLESPSKPMNPRPLPLTRSPA